MVKITYSGTAPGNDTNTYTLFDTTQAFAMKGQAAIGGTPRLHLNLKNSGTGTLKGYRSSDRGVTWSQVYQSAVTAPASTDSNFVDLLIAPFDDFKLDFTNGGSAQTTWLVDIGLSCEAGPSV